MFSLVSLLILGVAAAFYFTSTQVELQPVGGYQGLKSKAEAAAAQMQRDGQTQVDAATAPATPPATTNTPSSGN